MSLALNCWALRVSIAAVVSAGSVCGCGLDAGGYLAGQSAGGGGSGTSTGTSMSPTTGDGGGGGSASSSGSGGAGGMGGMGGGGGEIPAKCGDGILTAPEMCDDGNTEDGDACTADCTCGADHSELTLSFPGLEEGHCYLFFNTPKFPIEATEDCKTIGGYVATITTDEERMHVGGYLSQSVSIGGTDWQGFGVTQKWEWTNGEPWLIKPCDMSEQGCDNGVNLWNSKEPNGGTSEDCLELRGDNDKFNDRSCFDEMLFLCEKSP